MDRNVGNLIPEAMLAYNEWVKACNERGLYPKVTGVLRTLLIQVAFYAQGRQKYSEICALRSQAGLWLIGEKEAKKKITWTFMSKHIPEFCFPKDSKYYGKVLAVDFALKDKENNLSWSGKMDANESGGPDYKEAGMLAEEFGFRWGGRFGDNPHIEWIMK